MVFEEEVELVGKKREGEAEEVPPRPPPPRLLPVRERVIVGEAEVESVRVMEEVEEARVEGEVVRVVAGVGEVQALGLGLGVVVKLAEKVGERVEDRDPPPPADRGEGLEVFVGPPCRGLAPVGVGPFRPAELVRVGVDRGGEGVGKGGVGVADTAAAAPPVGKGGEGEGEGERVYDGEGVMVEEVQMVEEVVPLPPPPPPPLPITELPVPVGVTFPTVALKHRVTVPVGGRDRVGVRVGVGGEDLLPPPPPPAPAPAPAGEPLTVRERGALGVVVEEGVTVAVFATTVRVPTTAPMCLPFTPEGVGVSVPAGTLGVLCRSPPLGLPVFE